MRLVLATCFLFLSVFGVKAQEVDSVNIDSVEYTMADTVRARELLEEGKWLFNKNKLENALTKLSLAKKIFTQLHREGNQEVADCLHTEGRIYYRKRKYKKAIESWEEALLLREKILGTEHLKAAITSNNLGLAYTMKQEYEQGFYYFKNALNIRKKNLGKNDLLVAQTLNSIGWLFSKQQDYTQAIKYTTQALLIYEDEKNKPDNTLGLIYFNLEKYFTKIEKYDQALMNVQQALVIRKQVLEANNMNIGYAYHDHALILSKLGKYDDALIYYDSAKMIYSSNNSTLNEALIDNNIGVILNDTGNYAEGAELHKSVLSRRKKILGEDHPAIAQSYKNIALSLVNLDSFTSAIHYNYLALELNTKLFGDNSIETANVLHNLGFAYWKKGDYDKALEFNQNALYLKEETLPPDDSSIGWAHHNLGEVFESTGNYARALFHYHKSLVIFQKNLGPTHLDVGHIHYHLGWNYYLKGDLKTALSESLKALSIHQQVLNDDNIEIGRILNNLGVIYLNAGKNDLASEYFQKALNIAYHSVGPNNSLTGTFLMNAGVALISVGNFSEARKSLQKAKKIHETAWGIQHRETALAYLNLAEVLLNLDEYESTLLYAKKALEIYTLPGNIDNRNIALAYQVIGLTYLQIKQLDLAIVNLQKALTTSQLAYGESHYNIAKCFYHLGLLYSQLNEYSKARKYFQDALFNLNYLSSKQLSKISSVPLLIKVLSAKAKIQSTQTNQNIDYKKIRQLNALYDETLEIIDFFIHTKGVNENMLDKIDVFSVYESALSVNYKSNQKFESSEKIDKIAKLMERSKAIRLYQSMQESNALQFAGLPDTLLNQEYDLRIDMTYYDKKRQEKLSEGLEETDTTILALSSKLFDLNQSYDSLKTRFEKDYPEYYKLKYDLGTISLEEVQQELLEPGQALLEYFVGDSSIFIFQVTKEDYAVHEVKRDFPLDKWVEQLKNNISQPHTYNLEAYADAAQKLYQKLIAPLDTLPERLIIIPDGILGYIPFEALLTELPENVYAADSLSYLLHNHQISYSYSATLLREMQQKKHRQPPSREVLAMAPFAEMDTILTSHLNQSDWLAALRSDTLTALPGSRIELDSLKDIIQTDALYGEKATEQRFIEQAGDYRILHLSTHGKADARVGDYSYLAFYPLPDSTENEFLYVRDLYNLQLNADLVVLSACETGTGELQRGEGIISMARAFAYAGAKSIATTLWKVNDQSTQELMVGFYRHLKAGLPKDQALRQAKLDFLKDHSGSEAAPFFWAAVIGIGDMSKIKNLKKNK